MVKLSEFMPRLGSFQTNFIFYMTEKQLLIADVFISLGYL